MCSVRTANSIRRVEQGTPVRYWLAVGMLTSSHPWTASCWCISLQLEETVDQEPTLPALARAHMRLWLPEAANCSVSSLPAGPVLVLSHNELAEKRGLSSGWSWMYSRLPQGSDNCSGIRSKDMNEKEHELSGQRSGWEELNVTTLQQTHALMHTQNNNNYNINQCFRSHSVDWAYHILNIHCNLCRTAVTNFPTGPPFCQTVKMTTTSCVNVSIYGAAYDCSKSTHVRNHESIHWVQHTKFLQI